MKTTAIYALVATALLAAFSCGPDTSGTTVPPVSLRIWVADQPNKKVSMYDAGGNLIKVVGAVGMFSNPNDIAIYKPDGSTWICDFYTNRIRKFDAAGTPLYATPAPSEEGQEPLVRNATGITINDTNGDCWVSDRGHNRVIRLNADGTVVAKVTGFLYPRSVAATPSRGNIWVTDEGHDALILVPGTVQGDVSAGAVELARYNGLQNPRAVAGDKEGNCWVTSTVAGRAERIAQDGNRLAYVGGFGNPVAVAVNEAAGHVYVVDEEHGSVAALPRDLTTNAADYHTVAAFLLTGLSRPADIYVDDQTERLYVAADGGGAIRIYDFAGNEVSAIENTGHAAAVAVWNAEE